MGETSGTECMFTLRAVIWMTVCGGGVELIRFAMKLPGTSELGTEDSKVPLYFGLSYLK